MYKGGQAGVTKATVTITFDNLDKRKSPLGYEEHDEITVSRQVVIGGRNKYLINGSNAVPSRVQDLFKSVSLNVNNPHFLIMQVGILIQPYNWDFEMVLYVHVLYMYRMSCYYNYNHLQKPMFCYM